MLSNIPAAVALDVLPGSIPLAKITPARSHEQESSFDTLIPVIIVEIKIA
ncbi:MAG TPA: hypothetical protein VK463_18795 [Desulfomonilaceae bacterium]|nr:hypothetical protein [Desulfomonilaceae bacterium]